MKVSYFWMRLVFALSASVFLFSCGSKTKPAEVLRVPEIPADWRQYEQSEYTIRYPDSWESYENYAGADLCLLSPLSSAGDLFHENISVVAEPLVRTISLEKYAAMAIQKVYIEYKAKAVDEKKYILDGQVFYSASFQSNEGWFQQHYYVVKKKAYIVTFWYQPEESEKIKTDGTRAIQSFKLLTQ